MRPVGSLFFVSFLFLSVLGMTTVIRSMANAEGTPAPSPVAEKEFSDGRDDATPEGDTAPAADGETASDTLSSGEQEVSSAPPLRESVAQPSPRPSGFSRFFRRLFGMEKDEEKVGAEAPETEDSQAGTPDLLTPEGDTGGPSDEVLSEEYKSASRSWEPPNYAGQENALDWRPDTFDVPEGLRERVDFWKAIYSRYSTNQGVLHDSVHLHVVYEPIDFTSIVKDSSLTPRQKARAREGLVNARRKEHEDRLRRLATVRSAEGLTGEDLRVWKLFERIEEPNKFMAATKKGRVRFQLGQRDRFILGIYYSGRYIREMERIFRDAGLPIELTRLPFVESSFNIFARSKVGASGVWQFMRRTARPYMMVNNNVDERDDPIESTRASARLLKANFQMLGAWPLAVTGYNHGPSGVARIVKKTGTKDLATIINKYSSRTFGFASENFYACFLAALEVERNAPRHFGEVKWSTSFDGFEVPVSRPVSHKTLLSWFDGDDGLARLNNFHLKTPVLKGRSPIPKGTFLRVPAAKREQALTFLRGSLGPAHDVAGSSPAKVEAGVSSVSGVGGRSAESAAAAHSLSGPKLAVDAAVDGGRRYRVKRGDNLSRIARKHGVSVQAIRSANDLEDGTKLRSGQWLEIPD